MKEMPERVNKSMVQVARGRAGLNAALSKLSSPSCCYFLRDVRLAKLPVRRDSCSEDDDEADATEQWEEVRTKRENYPWIAVGGGGVESNDKREMMSKCTFLLPWNRIATSKTRRPPTNRPFSSLFRRRFASPAQIALAVRRGTCFLSFFLLSPRTKTSDGYCTDP